MHRQRSCVLDRGAEFVSPREWMRICFELLELLKAHKKAIRRATVNTFGYIAKAIGPQVRTAELKPLPRSLFLLLLNFVLITKHFLSYPSFLFKKLFHYLKKML